MSRFNLIDEKWIPVRFPDGSYDELGIRDTLVRAKEISGIEDASPLVFGALHRFLLAVLYRALRGPTDIVAAKEWFKSGFPAGNIRDYLEEWRDRFWLFDERYPFGQNPNVPEDEVEPWTKLSAEYNATSNKVLFDHTDTKNPGARKPKECARWLLSTMNYSIAGGRGYYPSPSPNAMMCVPIGRNLQETLCYCLVPYQNRDVMRGDSALWEREPKSIPLDIPKRLALGYADLYTWPSRMILLQEQPSGDVMVMRFVAGQGFDNSSNIADPMQAYRIDKVKGKLAIQFKKDRGTWRDFDSMLPDSARLAPVTIENALGLSELEIDLMPESVAVFGLRYEPPSANVDFWRMERFVLPSALAGRPEVRAGIKKLLIEAEEAEASLWAACKSFARDLLSRGIRKPDDRKPDDKDIRGFVKQISATSWYWSSLELRFHETLGGYTFDRQPDDIRSQWLKSVRDTLAAAWYQHREAVLMGDAWAIRALAKAELPVLRKQKELTEEISRLNS